MTEGAIKKGKGISSDQVGPNGEKVKTEDSRYNDYWEKHASEQSSPYSTYRRYTENGDIKQVTKYDKFWNCHRQYDLIDPRRGEHQHNFDQGRLRPKGSRSDHLPINE